MNYFWNVPFHGLIIEQFNDELPLTIINDVRSIFSLTVMICLSLISSTNEVRYNDEQDQLRTYS